MSPGLDCGGSAVLCICAEDAALLLLFRDPSGTASGGIGGEDTSADCEADMKAESMLAKVYNENDESMEPVSKHVVEDKAVSEWNAKQKSDAGLRSADERCSERQG